MKSLSWKLCLMAGISCLALFGNTGPAFAAEAIPAGPGEGLQQLERRVTDLADRQEQLMARLDSSLAAREQMGRQPGAPSQLQASVPASGSETLRSALPAAGAAHPVAARILKALRGLFGLFVLGCIACNLLLAFWIFTDIRKRGEGSGIFVALALVAGIPAAIIYSLVRIGDRATPNVK